MRCYLAINGQQRVVNDANNSVYIPDFGMSCAGERRAATALEHEALLRLPFCNGILGLDWLAVGAAYLP